MMTSITVQCQPDEKIVFLDIEKHETIWNGRSGLDGEISCFIGKDVVEVKVIFADRRIKKTREERREERWKLRHEAN